MANHKQEKKMKGKLFWVAAVRYPTTKAEEEGEVGKIVLEPTCVLAVDEDEARLLAAKELPDDISRVEVFCRPF
jgi:hypothetical protein